MDLALATARKCISVETAYNVGAVLVNENGEVISTGYSREIPGNTHAEQVCFLKAANEMNIKIPGLNCNDPTNNQHLSKFRDLFKGYRMYTTMEPCNQRLSGNIPCAFWIKSLGISQIFVGVKEPTHFIENANGAAFLEMNGIEVKYLEEFSGGRLFIRSL